MLVVAIGFGRSFCDPFTSTCTFNPSDVNIHDLDAVLSILRKERYLSSNTLDEVMIVDRDVIIKHYNFEDGLGQRLWEDNDDEDEEEVETTL